MDVEIWKKVDGYHNYEVSTYGRVRSLNYRNTNNTKILTPCIDGKGYNRINLCKEGKQKTFSVHRLVAIAFIPNPNNYLQVNNKDEDKTNNCVNNLEWCTAEYNSNYGTRNEKVRQKLKENPPKYMLGKFGKEHPNSKPINQYTKDGIFIRSWDSTMDVCRELGYSQGNISSCARIERKSAYGYVWRYA